MFVSTLPVSGWQEISPSESRGKNTLDRHDFLQLLVLQLRHQNPLEPMNEREFGAQLAQYSTLEEMQNTNKTLSMLLFLEAGGMIGKTVHLRDGNAGKVNGVILRDQEAFLEVNGKRYPMRDIVGVEG
ncbi:MAG TPA: flagellar hook capping FlgD N-terminal domain-containing protein [Atribacteraceae bacterium]|nr:flagellar hook capping FlgD N-terminal domain-containing protein [Atribacteraceae bacterium]